MFEAASSSDSDVDRYVIIINLLNSVFKTRWERISPYTGELVEHTGLSLRQVAY
jgi:hypothetical protein